MSYSKKRYRLANIGKTAWCSKRGVKNLFFALFEEKILTILTIYLALFNIKMQDQLLKLILKFEYSFWKYNPVFLKIPLKGFWNTLYIKVITMKRCGCLHCTQVIHSWSPTCITILNKHKRCPKECKSNL